MLQIFVSIVRSYQIKAQGMHVLVFYNFHRLPLPRSWLDHTIWFSILSRVAGFLWHGFKWAAGSVVSFKSGFEVLVCSLGTDFNDGITMLQLHLSLKH